MENALEKHDENKPLYVAGIDPCRKQLNWFQKILQKFGFYKDEYSGILILKYHKDGTIEQLKSQHGK